jgi:hypothetical protein
MPPFVPQDGNWSNTENAHALFDGLFPDALTALLNGTNQSDIFELGNFNPDDLLSDPQGEIEVSMGQLPSSSWLQMPMFGGPCDLSDFSSSTAGPSCSTAGPAETFFPDLFPMIDTSSSSDNNTIFQYLDFDQEPGCNRTVSMHEATPPKALSSAAPYTPPAGAAFSSTRRVAATWKPAFTGSFETPVDTSPRQWASPSAGLRLSS